MITEIVEDLDEARDLARSIEVPQCDMCGEKPAHVVIDSLATCKACTPHAEERAEEPVSYTIGKYGVVSKA